MILPLFRRNRPPDTISSLYGTIVAQARRPVFYRDYAVADTINGRFDLLLLHVALVVSRLMQEEATRPAGQLLFDRFCLDMDDNLREIGISDIAVPKHMKRVGEAFYGRAQAYEAALAAGDDRLLGEALARNIYGGQPPEPAVVARLAAYMRTMAAALAAEPAEAVAGGTVDLPDPTAAALVEPA
ncbi:MAG TPA: ubiquinol-cytochrome C chaperone family protein [Pseudolabrys sp.]|jgi:cytochrome b pre-mRNA-processing protein 3|uniref:ubiquinol-cytochrome C chaperone family protein n=1 Tax=Pseudolabrys sp. TaxID=1960880 RepID=UPI002DDD3D1F|nr:ubiquinol-cytochrome C chaperone family protein [Pseudolabrys sp.]HEV2630318.1 ubiquinol-cytochrome C chaperone family protein [Pseudolabrys sp.]